MINCYDELGGEMAIRKLVHRFYQLMDELPEASAVRELHSENLTEIESTLFEFLSGWFGGPGLYIAKKVIHACECVTRLMPSVRI